MTYVHQPYPKALYSPSGKMKIARNEDEHRAIEAEWASLRRPQEASPDGVEEMPVKRGPGRPRKTP